MKEYNHWREREDAILRQQRREDRISFLMAIVGAAIILLLVM
jgi:hypothetical protein